MLHDFQVFSQPLTCYCYLFFQFVIKTARHTVFERDGNNLKLALTISLVSGFQIRNSKPQTFVLKPGPGLIAYHWTLRKKIRKILQTFIDSDAGETTLSELAASLLVEVDEGGQLKNLPALKQAVLDYAVESVLAEED